MIGKHIANPKTRSSFQTLNDYITGKSKRRLEEAGEKIAFTGCLNLMSVDTATLQMNSLAFQNKRVADPVMHLLLSWRENERPTQEQTIEAVKIALGELNLSQCQAVYALHQNTDNMHLHICINRIDPETTKAIIPAGGWTRRAMERAARRIEHAQGWQTESNTWSEINEQGEVVRKPYSPENSIPQKVQDMENFTGEQSAIRKAQNVLKEKLKGLSTWEDFYNLLSLKGMKYEKKGSGAVIEIDGVIVKASDVSRNLTLGKLEKQFGPYQEIHHLAQYIYDDKSKSKIIPKPLDDANRDSENWNAYIKAKSEHFDDKKERRQRLYMTQRKERDELRDRQKLERQAITDSFGSGISRREINRQRSILATKHAYERAVLKERQTEQRKTFQSQASAFISYEQWLRNMNLAGEAEKWRQRKNKRILLLEMPEDTIVKESQDYSGLPGFSMTVTRQGVKFAHQGNPETVAFIDTGRLIKVYDQEGASILAALQLAQSKWGGVQVNGTDDYKRRCAELAVKNGIRIVNPELQSVQQEIQAKISRESSMSIYAMARELAQKALREPVMIVTNAREGREYSGLLLGVLEKNGYFYAAQSIGGNHVILHDADPSDLPVLEVLTGQEIELTSDNGRIQGIVDSISRTERLERNRGWSR
jgi:hypothetical protein